MNAEDETDVIYDRYGKPVLRLLANGRLITFKGESVGFLSGNDLYNYRGRHVGWYEYGIVRDHRGSVVGFGENVTASTIPYLPYKQYQPYRYYIHYEPHRPILHSIPFRPTDNYSWSSYEPIQLFLHT